MSDLSEIAKRLPLRVELYRVYSEKQAVCLEIGAPLLTKDFFAMLYSKIDVSFAGQHPQNETTSWLKAFTVVAQSVSSEDANALSAQHNICKSRERRHRITTNHFNSKCAPSQRQE